MSGHIFPLSRRMECLECLINARRLQFNYLSLDPSIPLRKDLKLPTLFDSTDSQNTMSPSPTSKHQRLRIVFTKSMEYSFESVDPPLYDPLPGLMATIQDAEACDFRDSEHPIFGEVTNACVFNAYLVLMSSRPYYLGEVALKWARGDEGHERLVSEYGMYKHLADLQGRVVPICHGLFRSMVWLNNGERIQLSCLVLEHCLDLDIEDHEHLTEAKLLAVHRLHTKGVIHGDLANPRNFMISNDGSQIRIISFQKATVHECTNTSSQAISSASSTNEGNRCEEIAAFSKMHQHVQAYNHARWR